MKYNKTRADGKSGGLKKMKDVTIIAPTGFFQANAEEKEMSYDVNNSEFNVVWDDGMNGTQQGSWNVYKNGELVDSFEGTYEALKIYIKKDNNEESVY